MHAFFRFQISVSILSAHLECHRLNPCNISVQTGGEGVGYPWRDKRDRVRQSDTLLCDAALQRVDFELIIGDLNINIIFNIWDHIAGHKGRLPFPRRIKWRNADKPMHAFFRFQISVSILSAHLEGGVRKPSDPDSSVWGI